MAPAPRLTPTPRVSTTPRYQPRVTPTAPNVPGTRSTPTNRYAPGNPAAGAPTDPGNGGARSGTPRVAPDYSNRLRDLYDRRVPSTGTDRTPRRLDPVAPAPRLTPSPNRSGTSSNDASRAGDGTKTVASPITPLQPRVPNARKPGAPDSGTSPTPRPISDRYGIPGRPPRVEPAPKIGTGPRVGRKDGTTPSVGQTGGLLPRVTAPLAPRVGDVAGDRRGGGPIVRGDRSGGRGSRFTPRIDNPRYDTRTYAGSQRYLYGCYHWAGHYAAFSPWSSRWGLYWYPFSYCSSWYDSWYSCNSSFVFYWNSASPAAARVSWWWPDRCYMPGSYFGYGTALAFDSGYTDWSYVPATTDIVVVDATPAAEPAEPAPDSLEALALKHVRLGDYYFKQGRYEEAAESYVRALTYAPEDGALHFVLADALFAQADYHYAAYMLGKGLALDPGLVDALADKRTFYGDAGDFERQMAELDTYLADKPYDAAAWLMKGYNLRFSGRSTEALPAFQRVLEIEPGHGTATSFLEAILAAAEAEAAGAGESPRNR
ncbi:MAG: tetratricopeptide repeat protein [Planctomycetota bacterium]